MHVTSSKVRYIAVANIAGTAAPHTTHLLLLQPLMHSMLIFQACRWNCVTDKAQYAFPLLLQEAGGSQAVLHLHHPQYAHPPPEMVLPAPP